MKNEFDQAVDAIRADAPDPVVEAEAGARVHRALFSSVADSGGRIHDCVGFRSLISPYLQKTLSEPRRLLLEDHVLECVPCRRAFDEARTGKPSVVAMPAQVLRPRPQIGKWAIAAALLVAAGGITWYTVEKPSAGEFVAQVDSVDGFLYQVSDHGILPVGRGRQLGAGDSVRSGRGGHSVVRLGDGTMIEMNERTELSVDRGWRGTTIHLDRGDIIVQAAKQKSGKLYVVSGDSTVSVKGTIFAVKRGTKGTRVSVVEGAVQVDRTGAATQMLKPGGQSNSDPTLTEGPVADDVSWSRDSARYLALLGELSGLERKLSAIPSPALRYQSKLLNLIPADTMIYAAIPNAGQQLRDARQVFEEQTRSNAVLADWWKGHASKMKDLTANLDKLQTFSSYIGDEVVVAIRPNEGVSILAEAKSPEVMAFLDQELADVPKMPRQLRNGVLFMSSSEAGLVAKSTDMPSPFQQRIEQSYKSGAGWLLAVDMARLTGGASSFGLDNLRYVVLERREVSNRPETTAALNFGEQRTGVASWLGAPGPLSTLDFVSPDAGAAAAFTMRNPKSMVQELLAMIPSLEKDVDAHLGINLINDLAASLGSEVTFAQDGPLLPDLSWKAVIEVNAPQSLQHSLEQLVTALKPMMLTTEGTFYKLSGSPLPMPIYYTYADGYLIAAPSQLLITQALANRHTGHSLTHSEKFRAQLPYGRSPYFSAILYNDIAQVVSPVAEQLKKINVLTEQQRKSADQIQTMTPGLIAINGEPNRISITSMGGFFGMNLGVLAGLDRGLPYLIPSALRQ